MTILFDEVQIGDSLPDLVSPKISRHVLAMFGGASGDHNPMHIDSDYAKAHGLPDVFAQGMLSMAYLARLLTQWVSPFQLRDWGARFLSITPLYATVTCTGVVVDKFEIDGERRVKLEINAHTDAGLHTLAGDAVISLS
jgi:acyl dehydratase